MPVAYELLKMDAQMVCLIKPQFEAGREKVGKNGVVREAKTHEEVREIEFWLYVDVYNDKNSFDLENELSKLKVKIEDLNLEEKNIRRTLRRIEERGVING